MPPKLPPAEPFSGKTSKNRPLYANEHQQRARGRRRKKREDDDDEDNEGEDEGGAGTGREGMKGGTRGAIWVRLGKKKE